MTRAQLRAKVLAEGGFDTDNATVDGWLNAVYRRLVADSLWRKAVVTIANTVAGTSAYALSDDVVDLEWARINGVRHYRVGTGELEDVRDGIRSKTGSGGLFAPTFSATGVESIDLYPTPAASGLAIEALCALQAPELDDDADVPAVPLDFHEDLADAAIAYGLRRLDERLQDAAAYEQSFLIRVEELRRRRNSRQGSGPSRIALGR